MEHSARVNALLVLWQERSRQTGWRYESDWHCNATRTVAFSLILEEDPENSFIQLASTRAFQGVGIVESLNDIKALEAVWIEKIPSYLVNKYLESWVETNCSSHLGWSHPSGSSELLGGSNSLNSVTEI